MTSRSRVLAFILGIGVTTGVWYSWQKKIEWGGHGGSVDMIEVLRIKGGALQVSTIRSPEYFTSTVIHKFFGIRLGTTIAQIVLPATYTYVVHLATAWKVTVKDNVFTVVAPAVKANSPVAIDTQGIKQQSSGIWSAFTGQSQLDALLKAVTPVLDKKAMSPSYVQFQREAARATVKEFVEKWLVTQESWKGAKGLDIKVFFSDEPIGALQSVPSASVSIDR